MGKSISLTIDDKPVTVPEGTLVIDAAKQAGVYIPVFCYHPKMEPVGMCRMCLVEVGRPMVDRATGQVVLEADGFPRIQFGPKLDTACTMPVSEGMVVRGFTDTVNRARRDILEFLLTSHPLDCPICDKGGECPLQNLTMDFGPGQSRFIYDEKFHLAKHYPLGDLIFLDRERCIQCARCIRFQDEIADDPVIGFAQRGRALQIITSSEPGFDSYFSGNTTDICPVGALTTVDFHFGARPWEMNAAASICAQCPVGCNLTLNVRRENKAGGEFVIKRIMPRQNEQVNELWICDKGRFAYHYTESKDRLTQPMIRQDGDLVPASWDQALDLVAERFGAVERNLLIVGSGRLANEDLYNLQQLAAHQETTARLYTHMAGGDLVARVGVGQGTNFSAMGPETAILVVACDLLEEAPIYWLRVKQAAGRGAKLIVANPRPTKLERYADQVIRYPYGAEAAALLTMLNTLSAKRPEIGDLFLNDPATRAALQAGAQLFSAAENAVILFGSEGTSLASSGVLAQACANLLIATGHIGREQNGLIGVWPRANDQGAWDMGFRLIPDLHIAMDMAKALYIVAADPFGDYPALNREHMSPDAFLVVQELTLTRTAQLADVVLPALPFVEREGTYTSAERRVQRFYPVIPPRPQARADFAISAQIGKRLGLDLEGKLAIRVFDRLAAKLPHYRGLTYQQLAQVVDQWPIIARADLYYGGTSYENTQGLGVQLQPAAQRGESVALGWLKPEAIKAAPEGSWLAVPVTRLYDRGQTVLASPLLHGRIAQPYVSLHPADASAQGIAQGDVVRLILVGAAYQLIAHLDENVPQGVALVPRSMGVPITVPIAVKIERFEHVMA
jgi:NADH-quinone oxidoreductase subunit G